MECLILAAGRGTRLRNIGEPKPLVRLLGLTLIERVILTIKSCGINTFYVVLGYKAELVKEFLKKFSQKNNVKINYIINEEWEKENGISVLKAKEVISGKFLLCMSDHIFDESVIKNMLQNNIGEKEIALGVSQRIIVNDEEATKVLTENGRIKDIGKDLREYNGYDIGLFLCSPIIFDFIEESIKNGDETLSGAIRLLAKKGYAKAVDVKEGLWIDVDDYNAYKKAEILLSEQLSKKGTDGFVSKYLNRPFSLRITKYLVNTDITPNKISFFSFFLSFIAFLLFLLDKYIYLLSGGLLAQISSIIDGCDGEIARLKMQSSKFGAWLDAVLDRYADAFLLFGLTIYAYRPEKSFLPLFAGFLAIIGSLINSYTADKYDQFVIQYLKSNKKKVIRIGRDIRVFLIFIGAILNQALLMLLIIATIMNLENIRRIKLVYEIYKTDGSKDICPVEGNKTDNKALSRA